MVMEQFSNLACLCEAIRVINDHMVSDHKVTYKDTRVTAEPGEGAVSLGCRARVGCLGWMQCFRCPTEGSHMVSPQDLCTIFQLLMFIIKI